MTGEKNKPDWSKGCWTDMLMDQRKFMWRQDTLEKLATWLELRPGMTAVDVGCGLGNLGYTYWPYFGKGGHYFGIDKSSELVRDATLAGRQWATQGEVKFITADAYDLPFDDGFADWAMCQTLLIHLERPQAALAEMVRIAKPGGLVMCNEPDNLSTGLAKQSWSLPELDVDEELLIKKVQLVSNKGAIKLGRGDQGIGRNVPALMKQLGLVDIDVRTNDKATFLNPPYQGPQQQNLFLMIKKRVLEQDDFWTERTQEEFLAGGGDPEEFKAYRKIADRIKLVFEQQLKEGTYTACNSGFFYLIKARKPK